MWANLVVLHIVASFKSLSSGREFCRFCKRVKLLADNVGVYTLVLFKVFPRDLFVRVMSTR